MASDSRVELLHVAQAPRDLREHGMLAWLQVRVGAVVIDGLSLREARDGTLSVSFPIRADAEGRRHPVVRPLDDATRQAIPQATMTAVIFRLTA